MGEKKWRAQRGGIELRGERQISFQPEMYDMTCCWFVASANILGDDIEDYNTKIKRFRGRMDVSPEFEGDIEKHFDRSAEETWGRCCLCWKARTSG